VSATTPRIPVDALGGTPLGVAGVATEIEHAATEHDLDAAQAHVIGELPTSNADQETSKEGDAESPAITTTSEPEAEPDHPRRGRRGYVAGLDGPNVPGSCSNRRRPAPRDLQSVIAVPHLWLMTAGGLDPHRTNGFQLGE
jgi:hypothetical protein